MKASKLMTVLPAAIKAGNRVLIKGAPGVGKSDIVAEICAVLGAVLVLSHPSISDPTDYKGLPANVNGKAEFLPFGDLRKLVEAKKLTVCFLDDIGQAAPAVQAALMQLVLARQVNGVRISDSVVFIGATNDIGHQAGVSGMIEPLKSRFDTIIELTVDAIDWCAWAAKNSLAPELIAYIRLAPAELGGATWKPTREIKNGPCPRTWASVGKWLAQGITDAEILAGAVGEAAATQFLSFLNTIQDLPSKDEIFANPSGARLPLSANGKYAVASMLAKYSTKQNMGDVLTYMERIGQEMTTFTVKDAIARDKTVQENAGMIRWFQKNAKFLA